MLGPLSDPVKRNLASTLASSAVPGGAQPKGCHLPGAVTLGFFDSNHPSITLDGRQYGHFDPVRRNFRIAG